MEQKEIKALIKRIDWSVTAIEKKLKMSQGTLAKAAKGERGLKEQWHTPLRALADIRRFEKQPHLKQFVKAKYSEKDLVPVVPGKYDNVISEIDPTAGDMQVANKGLHDAIMNSGTNPSYTTGTLKLEDINNWISQIESANLPEIVPATKEQVNNNRWFMATGDIVTKPPTLERQDMPDKDIINDFCLEYSCTPQDLIDAYKEKHQPIPRPSQDLLDLLP